MAREHERWILELFHGLDARGLRQLHTRLGELREHLMHDDLSPEEAP